MTDAIEILGIRHHGPGSARAVRRALDALNPTVVLIEGPPELDAVAALAAEVGMSAPVAGLVYDVAAPQHASFYPMANFSPEWVALQWALRADATVQFADLPAANRLAHRFAPPDEPEADPLEAVERAAAEADDAAGDDAEPGAVVHIDHDVDAGGHVSLASDPITALATAAGYDDAERWWEDAIEQRVDATDPLARFAAVRQAMADVRADLPADQEAADQLLEREASMRKILRAARKKHDGPIAFICGAFHAPALHPDAWPTISADNAQLKGLPKTKVAATWAPWTSARLSYRSGYGAGVTAPRWYQHLFEVGDDVVAHWMVDAARLLRADGHNASSASAVEATRLAHALAALRGRPAAGLAEVADAAVSVLGNGSARALDSIAERLFVGTTLGTVPPSTPLVPLARDLAKLQKSLRLKPSAESKTITVDLRKESQLARSVFFRRLGLLGIPWAVEVDAGRTTGTFKEAWQLEWFPELAVLVIEASLHGTTVHSAAAAKVTADAANADSLGALAELVEACLLADLPTALASVLRTMEVRTAATPDQLALMATVEPLARTRRYGDVRQVETDLVASVLSTVVARASIGLAAACASLDDDAAAVMRRSITSVERGVALLDDAHLRELWHGALSALSETVHGAVAGTVARILLDAGELEAHEAAGLVGRALSSAIDPARSAAWLDGFLAGDVALVLHDPTLFSLIDDWLVGLHDGAFEDLLPLVRRTFARFQPAERRQIGELVSRRGSSEHAPADADEVDHERAAAAVARVANLLGLDDPDADGEQSAVTQQGTDDE